MPDIEKQYERDAARMNEHAAICLQILAEGLGKGTWDASDLAYFAAALGSGTLYMDTLRKVYAGEKLAQAK